MSSLSPVKYIVCPVYTTVLNYPFDSLQTLFLNSKTMKNIFQDKDFKIKPFIGSDSNINGSGFIWQGLDNITVVLINNIITNQDFSKSYIYKISHINDQIIKGDNFFEIHIIKNTCENTSILKSNFRYLLDFDFSLFKSFHQNFILIMKKFSDKINEYLIDKQELFTSITHSMIINNHYIESFYFFRDMRNFVKGMGTEGKWDVKVKSIISNSNQNSINYNNNSNHYDCKYNNIFSIKVNSDTIINYTIITGEDKKDEYKSFTITKTSGNCPCLNGCMKLSFYNIDKKKCLLIHETKIPVNIPSPIFNTLNDFTLYCIKKTKNLLESKINNNSKNNNKKSSKIIINEEEKENV